MIVSGSTIHKQKRKFVALISVPSYFPLPTPIFYKMMLRFWKNSGKKCSGGIRSSSSSYFNLRKQQGYIRLSIQLRRQGVKQRKRPRRKLKGRELQRRRRGRGRQQSISNSSETRYQRKRLLYWRGERVPGYGI